MDLEVWICPRCNTICPAGHQTVFGKYTKADAALNHIEEFHPEVAL